MDGLFLSVPRDSSIIDQCPPSAPSDRVVLANVRFAPTLLEVGCTDSPFG